MTHRAAGSISLFLLQKGVIDSEDTDIYQYGFEILMDSVLETLFLLIFGIVFGKLIETVVFVLSFAMLRRYTGGYHTSTKTRCVFMTVGVYAVNLVIACNPWIAKQQIILTLSVISTFIIWRLAPVSHTNKKLDMQQIMRNRKISRCISLLYLAVIFALKESLTEIGDIVGVTLFQTAILILMQRRCISGE